MAVQIDHDATIERFSTYSRDMLNFVIRDAQAAIEANKEGDKVGFYADEIHYAAAEIRRRGGLPILDEAEATATEMMKDGSICSVWIAFHSVPLRRRMFVKFGRDGLIMVKADQPGDDE